MCDWMDGGELSEIVPGVLVADVDCPCGIRHVDVVAGDRLTCVCGQILTWFAHPKGGSDGQGA